MEGSSAGAEKGGAKKRKMGPCAGAGLDQVTPPSAETPRERDSRGMLGV